jgi:medium-chain acyl-[acyl-carrier-protein] hydrolase
MQTPPWIIRTGAKEPVLRLFCFPYAGGGASIYRQWSSKLPTWVEICAIQLPGRENRFCETAYTKHQEVVSALTRVIDQLLDGPFCFFGYSMGALISFELARALRHNNQPQPRKLFVAACHAPQQVKVKEKAYLLPDHEFQAKIQKLGGTPEVILQNAELMQLLLPLLRADFTLHETYTYKEEPPLTYPIHAITGTEDKEVNIQDVESWHEQTCSTFKLEMIKGNHFFIHSQQDLLLRSISRELQNWSACQS